MAKIAKSMEYLASEFKRNYRSGVVFTYVTEKLAIRNADVILRTFLVTFLGFYNRL